MNAECAEKLRQEAKGNKKSSLMPRTTTSIATRSLRACRTSTNVRARSKSNVFPTRENPTSRAS